MYSFRRSSIPVDPAVNCKGQLRANGLIFSFWGRCPSFQLSNVVNGSSTDQEEASQNLRILGLLDSSQKKEENGANNCQSFHHPHLGDLVDRLRKILESIYLFLQFLADDIDHSSTGRELRGVRNLNWTTSSLQSIQSNIVKSNLRSWPSPPFSVLWHPCARQLLLSETSSPSPPTWPSCCYHMARLRRWKLRFWQRCWWSWHRRWSNRPDMVQFGRGSSIRSCRTHLACERCVRNACNIRDHPAMNCTHGDSHSDRRRQCSYARTVDSYRKSLSSWVSSACICYIALACYMLAMPRVSSSAALPRSSQRASSVPRTRGR